MVLPPNAQLNPLLFSSKCYKYITEKEVRKELSSVCFYTAISFLKQFSTFGLVLNVLNLLNAQIVPKVLLDSIVDIEQFCVVKVKRINGKYYHEYGETLKC